MTLQFTPGGFVMGRRTARILFSLSAAAVLGATSANAGVAGAAPATTGPAAGEDLVAHAWVTTPDGRLKLSDQGTVMFATGSPPALTVTVDPSRSFQTMSGFGGSITDSSAYELYQLDPQHRVQAMAALFDPRDGDGLSTGDYSRGYAVSVSDDGTNWTGPVATGTGSGQITPITLPPAAIRFVRVTLTASAASWRSVADVRAYLGPR